jgi:uncharacterized phiE125 gp8 family phage protein
MALSLVAAPASEPLSIADVKSHLRLDSTTGEPAPTAITIALAALGAGNLTNGAYRYLATFVTADGETDAGQMSAAVTVADKTVNGQIALSAIPIGGSAVTARKLYRTVAGGTLCLLLATLADNTTSVYADNIADASLGVQAPITNTTADPALGQWITSAREFVESFTHRALITQTWDLQLDGFPLNWSTIQVDVRQVDGGAIWIPKPPLISVTSVIYVATDGSTPTWAASNYTVDAPQGEKARMGRLVPAWSIYYPVTRSVPNAATVRFVAGYGAAAAVPSALKSAMKLLIGNWYLNREAGEIIRGSADVLPFGVEALLWPFKAF